MPRSTPLIEAQSISMHFGNVVALDDVSLQVHAGEVMCLLGDNGAGKSTLIKILSGVYRPTQGKIRIKGKEVHFRSPAHAISKGVATVYQELALFPQMSITRNFFAGREPATRGWGPLRRIAWKDADAVAREEIEKMGIHIGDPRQALGTLSRGQQQCVAIARAVYFGVRILMLDEPTSALSVERAGVVLRYIKWARSFGLAVIFITHNAYHAYLVGDAFTILNRGKSCGTFRKEEIDRGTALGMIGGDQELETLGAEIAALVHADRIGAVDDRAPGGETVAGEELAEALSEEAHRPLGG